MAENDPRLQFRPSPQASDVEGTLSALLDLAFADAWGTIIQRNQDGWRPLAPGNPGDVYTCGGGAADNYWSPSGSYAAPAFTAFGISGQSTPIEVGSTIAAGNKTFTWATSNSANVKPNSLSIVDTTAGVTLASGLANDGSEIISISAITNTSPASQVWTINGTNTNNANFSRTYTVTWLWRVYAGTNASGTLTANQIKALSDSSALQSSFAGTYSLSAGNYKYFASPDSLGSPSSFFDPVNNFPISMATSADDPAYSNVANGYSYDLVSVTNAQSVTTNYRVYRSQYVLGGTLTMRVS